MRAQMLQKNTYRVRFTSVRKAKTQEAGTLHAFAHEGHAHIHQQSCLIDCSKCFQYCTLAEVSENLSYQSRCQRSQNNQNVIYMTQIILFLVLPHGSAGLWLYAGYIPSGVWVILLHCLYRILLNEVVVQACGFPMLQYHK